MTMSRVIISKAANGSISIAHKCIIIVMINVRLLTAYYSVELLVLKTVKPSTVN